MARRLILTGSPFERAAGYSRAVSDGDWCWIAGTTGYDYATMRMPENVADQARNAMETVDRTLRDAGFALSDVVRATYYVVDAIHADVVFEVVGSYFRDIRPAATMIVCGLVRGDMKVEIEVTARRRPA